MFRNPPNIKCNQQIMIRDNKNGRISCDHYATPLNTVQNLLNNIVINEMNILEPSAGEGNIIRVLRENGYNGNITAMELRYKENQELTKYANSVIIGDFLSLKTNEKYDLIIGNPPFSKALEFVEKCFDLINDNGRIILLLRTAFLESKSRYDFWQRHPLSALYVLSKRPSFTGHDRDATSYSWFEFKKNVNIREQTIKVI